MAPTNATSAGRLARTPSSSAPACLWLMTTRGFTASVSFGARLIAVIERGPGERSRVRHNAAGNLAQEQLVSAGVAARAVERGVHGQLAVLTEDALGLFDDAAISALLSGDA
jgi:hypothetical protein